MDHPRDRHQHWHDIESLLLCLFASVYGKWARKIESVASKLDYRNRKGATSDGPTRWLNSQARDMHALVSKSRNVQPWEREVALTFGAHVQRDGRQSNRPSDGSRTNS